MKRFLLLLLVSPTLAFAAPIEYFTAIKTVKGYINSQEHDQMQNAGAYLVGIIVSQILLDDRVCLPKPKNDDPITPIVDDVLDQVVLDIMNTDNAHLDLPVVFLVQNTTVRVAGCSNYKGKKIPLPDIHIETRSRPQGGTL